MPGTTYYLSKITLLDGTQVEIKDAVARAAIQGGTYFLGVTTTELADGSTTSTIEINGSPMSVINGNMAVYGNKEFVYALSDARWHELGDVTNLGALALKDTATAIYTPAGTVSFSGNSLTSTGTFTPSGSVSKPNVSVTKTTATITEFNSAGSVVAGSAASCTLPTLSTTYDAITENLTLSWTAGSFTANTPTQVTLPTSKNTSVLADVSAELAATPTFTGTQGNVSVSGTPTGTATFSGTMAMISVS